MRGGLQPYSERERQHQCVLARLPGVLVIALPQANLTKAQSPVEAHCGSVVAAHLEEETLRPGPLGGVHERTREPTGNAVPAMPLMHAEREKLCLIGRQLPHDEADGLRRGRNARQERGRPGMR